MINAVRIDLNAIYDKINKKPTDYGRLKDRFV